MNRTITMLFAGLMIVVLTGCSLAQAEPFVLRVSGPPGTSFQGECSAVDNGGMITERDVEGNLTAGTDALEFALSGTQVTCTASGSPLDGTLTLELLCDGETFDTTQTAQASEEIVVGTPEWGSLTGHVTIGPLVPVSREGEPDPTPAPEVYAARQIVILDSDGQPEVARAEIDPHGDYRIALPSGTYVVDFVTLLGMDMGSNLPATVEITAGQATRLDVDIDTGIR